jgi:N-acetylglutamate synthase-like GNAT family acetyltransferase
MQGVKSTLGEYMSEPGIVIRAATASDAGTIRTLIKRGQLDSSSVHWGNFLLAEHEGQIIGMGQLKPYPDCTELGSLYTLRQYRGQKVASRIIAALELKARFPLYLICRDKMEAYYQRFGYRTIPWRQAPRSLKLKIAFTWLFLVFGIRVLVMRKEKL